MQMMMTYSLKDRKAGPIDTESGKEISMEFSLSKRVFKTETSPSEGVSAIVTGYSLRERKWVVGDKFCKPSITCA